MWKKIDESDSLQDWLAVWESTRVDKIRSDNRKFCYCHLSFQISRRFVFVLLFSDWDSECTSIAFTSTIVLFVAFQQYTAKSFYHQTISQPSAKLTLAETLQLGCCCWFHRLRCARVGLKGTLETLAAQLKTVTCTNSHRAKELSKRKRQIWWCLLGRSDTDNNKSVAMRTENG